MLFMGTIPSYAGPVRSARVPMGSLREIWDSAWVFYGWQNWAKGPNLVVDVDDWALSVHSDARQKGRWVFRLSRAPSAITAICSAARTTASTSRRTTFRST